MASADQQERNIVRKAGVVRYSPVKDSGTTAATRDAGPAGYLTPGMYSTLENAGASLNDAQVANLLKPPKLYGGTTPTGSQTTAGGFESLLAGLLGSGGGTTGPSASNILDRDKFNYEKKQDALKLSGLQNYYDSGTYNNSFDEILKMINTQGGVSEKAVKDAYGRAITNINEGYDVASGLGTQGYNALNQYLAQNQNNPYAGMQATVGSAPDALSSYLSAYGVSDQPVQGQIQADQLQAQQGAGNYQNLINLLGGIAEQGSASRGAESQMAQLLFNTGLGQEQAGYRSQAGNSQAQALAQLAAELAQQRIGVESNRGSLANQLALALAEAGGTPTTRTNTNTGTNDFAAEVAAAYAPKEAAYNRPAQTNEEIAALRAVQEAARQNEIRQQMARARGGY